MEQRPVSRQVCLSGESAGPDRTIEFLKKQVCFHTTHTGGKLVCNNTKQLILKIVSKFLVSLDAFAGSAGL